MPWMRSNDPEITETIEEALGPDSERPERVTSGDLKAILDAAIRRKALDVLTRQ